MVDRYMWKDEPFTDADAPWIHSYWAREPVPDRPLLWEILAG